MSAKRKVEGDVGGASNKRKTLENGSKDTSQLPEKSADERLLNAVRRQQAIFVLPASLTVTGSKSSQTFTMHLHLVRSRCPKLAEKHLDDEKLSNNQLSAEPDIFKIFLNWVYWNKFGYHPDALLESPASQFTFGEVDQASSYLPLIRLCALADYLEIPVLGNLAIDCMLEIARRYRCLPSVEVINWTKAQHGAMPEIQAYPNFIRLAIELWAWQGDTDSLKGVYILFKDRLLKRKDGILQRLARGEERDKIKEPVETFYLTNKKQEFVDMTEM